MGTYRSVSSAGMPVKKAWEQGLPITIVPESKKERAMDEKPTYLWKAMRKNLYSHYKKKKWQLGEWYKVKGTLEMCWNGFHASEKVIDSMGYVPMECLAKVEVRGDNEKQSDKQCWREMKIEKVYRWEKKDSVALSIYAAELVIKNFEKKYPSDKRPREAIQAAKKWLKNPTKKNQDAARSAESAAWSAASAAWSAESAAWSARSAAWSAESATWSARSAASATWSAAWSAAWSARSAASAASARSAAILDKIESWIQKRIKTLEEINV